MHNLEAQVPAKTGINLIIPSNKCFKNNSEDQILSEFETANNKQSEIDNDFLVVVVVVVDTNCNSIFLLNGHDCGFEHDPHTSSVDYKGHLGDQVHINVNTQFRDEINANSGNINAYLHIEQ